MNSPLQLEERTCACGCGKTFRCLPTSQTRYSSLHCMEAAGALPPADGLTRGGKAARSGGASARADDGDSDGDADADADADVGHDETDADETQPLLLDEDDDGLPTEHVGEPGQKGPPEIDPAA